MERFQLRLDKAKGALHMLTDVLKQPPSEYIRDSSIQRFEYSFEAAWQFLQSYLKEKEGVVANSPKQVFREVFAVGLLSEQETEQALKMTDDRNQSVHNYNEDVAQQIFERLPGYERLLTKILKNTKLN